MMLVLVLMMMRKTFDKKNLCWKLLRKSTKLELRL